jgi:outer membrane autotransporter protein
VNSYNGELGFNGGATGGNMVAPNTGLNGKGTSVNVILSNRFDVSDTVYVEPLAGLTWGRYSFDDVYFNPAFASSGVSGRMALAPIESWLARIGANLGGTFAVDDNLYIAPFVHGSVWHEFAGNSTATAYVSASNQSFAFPVTTDRVNTFGQVGLGVQFKVLNLDLLGFVRGDVRFGDSINGKAINIGVRKQF